MIRNILFISTGLLVLNGIQAQVPKYSNEFLAVGVGARAFGMSNSVSASTVDVTAGFWNPAGLMGLETDADVGLMHAEYLAGIANPLVLIIISGDFIFTLLFLYYFYRLFKANIRII